MLRTNRTVAIYWQPAGWTMASGYQSTISQYFTDVAHGERPTDNVYAVETQYYDSDRQDRLQLVASAARSSTRTRTRRAAAATPSRQTSNCLSDSQIRAELQRLYSPIRSLGGREHDVLRLHGEGRRQLLLERELRILEYCAYHSNVSLGGTTVQYANQPYTDTVPPACDAGYHPNGASTEADPTINVASHEHRESINDPLGTAWYDRQGYEGSDKCAWNFGAVCGQHNQTINGDHYILQQEWSNASSGCALHG